MKPCLPQMCLCVRGVSHVGRWGKWSSRRSPRHTPPEVPPPGRSLCRTGPPQRARRSGCVPEPCRAARVWARRSLRPPALRGGNGDSQTWQPHKSEVMEPNISLRSQVGAGALQVPLARQESVFVPTSCSPASHA